MKFDAIILAGGNSVRAGSEKMAFSFGNQTVLERTASVFCESPYIANVIIVIREDLAPLATEVASSLGSSRFKIVFGGDTRAQSAINGLAVAETEYVLIHDGARPYLTQNLIRTVCEATEIHGSAVPALPLTDSARIVENGVIVEETDRNRIRRVQTPQGYRTKEILDFYKKAVAEGYIPTDESVLYAKYANGAHVVDGEETNSKITSAGDFVTRDAVIGIGTDLHRLVPYRKLMLGGIEVSYELGELAHSDGDVVIHAIIDALLSALGQSDIGCRFPDDDPKYLDIDSTLMLSEVMYDCRKANKKVASCNVIIELERPKLKDYIPVMRVKLANLLETSRLNVSVSAKTNEGLGPVGEGLAVKAYATVVLI